MERYICTFKIGDLKVEDHEVNASNSKHLKQEIIKALKSGRYDLIALSEDREGNAAKAENPGNGTYVRIVLPSHPDNIKGSGGDVRKACIIVLESYNTDLKSIDQHAASVKILFEYTGEVHYTIEEKKEPNHYDSYTFVAKGYFGISDLQKTYKNEIVRLCLEALNDADTVLYERSQHTTDFDPDLPDELQLQPFDHLIVQLSIPVGAAEYDENITAESTSGLQPQHFDINVFNDEGIFMPEKIVYDSGDGVRKLIVSLYYQNAV